MGVYFIPFMIFSVDLMIGFNTGIFEFGVIVKDRKLISKAFWKNQFTYHLALTIALFLDYKLQSIFIQILGVYIRLYQVRMFIFEVDLNIYFIEFLVL